MNKEALEFMNNLKASYEKQKKNCERRMDKYSIATMGYQDAKEMKQELEKRIKYVNYIISVLMEEK